MTILATFALSSCPTFLSQGSMSIWTIWDPDPDKNILNTEEIIKKKRRQQQRQRQRMRQRMRQRIRQRQGQGQGQAAPQKTTALSALLLTQLCESFFETITVIFFAVLFLKRAFLSSMAAAIPRVQEMISKLIESGSKIPTWVLTSSNDPDVDVLKETKDVE